MSDEEDRTDWKVYKRLNRLQGAGVQLSAEVQERLRALRQKHPKWQLDGTERDEFSIWSETSVGDRGDPDDLAKIPEDQILAEVRRRKSADRLGSGGLWRNFTRSDPLKAFHALRAEYERGGVDVDEWEQLFFELREPLDDLPLHDAVMDFVIDVRLRELAGAAAAIANWIESKDAKFYELDGGSDRIFQLWDLLAETQRLPEDPDDFTYSDIMTAVLNDTPGVLVEILVNQIELNGRTLNKEINLNLLLRFQQAIVWPGQRGVIAQCALLQRLPWLETMFSDFVHRELVPLLNLHDDHSLERWQARFYHTHPGTVKLFARTKEAFLQTFSHIEDIPNDEHQVLLLINVVHARLGNEEWPIEKPEARQAMLQGGQKALANFARILWRHSADERDEDHWRNLVKPLLNFMWPMDTTARGKRATSGLLQLIFGAGKCFGDAVETIGPELTPVWSMQRSWEMDNHFDDDTIRTVTRFPKQLLQLLERIVDREDPPVHLNLVLDRLEAADQRIARTPAFRTLRGLARKSAA